MFAGCQDRPTGIGSTGRTLPFYPRPPASDHLISIISGIKLFPSLLIQILIYLRFITSRRLTVHRVLVFGNSGSGKSTLAKSLSQSKELPHFDLDSIAWLPTDPPERSPLSKCADQINQFTALYDGWVIEGCYADLIEFAAPCATEMIFLNLPVEDCVANARSRPWEPHKYLSKEAQDDNLEMLIDWIRAYPHRDGTCSLQSHLALYERFRGEKAMETTNRPTG